MSTVESNFVSELLIYENCPTINGFVCWFYLYQWMIVLTCYLFFSWHEQPDVRRNASIEFSAAVILISRHFFWSTWTDQSISPKSTLIIVCAEVGAIKTLETNIFCGELFNFLFKCSRYWVLIARKRYLTEVSQIIVRWELYNY